MRYVKRPLIACLVLWTAGCAKDGLNRNAPHLVVTVDAEGQVYETYDDEAGFIDLGEVPVFAAKAAVFKLSNPTALPLHVASVTYTTVTGHRWMEPTVSPVPAATRYVETQELDFKITAFGEASLRITYSPLEEGEHRVIVAIQSDASNGALKEVTVEATAIFTGEPDIEIEYDGYRTPTVAADYCVDGVTEGCKVPLADGLSLGNIGLGAAGSARLIIRNTAQCDPFAGVDACSLCSLTIAEDPSRQNIGLGFKEGTNTEGYFSFAGSTATPLQVRRRNLDAECSESGELRLLIDFQAPSEEGDHSTTIVIESNDPDEPLIEIPVVASARNAPIAIASFRAYDAANPGGNYTDPADIELLERVFFDASDSYDPADPANPAAIAGWEWKVLEYPNGTNPNDFQWLGATSKLSSFWLPLAGHYVVQLKVWNETGLESGNTPQSRVEFDVIPGSAVHVQLTWDNATNDQDLHLLNLTDSDQMCSSPSDCYFANKKPVWFSTSAGSNGPNPTLDIDDTNGLGPENINIKSPESGTYRIMVHNWRNDGAGPTRNTVRVYLHGLQIAEYRRTLEAFDQWTIADITWNADDTSYMTPYPSDVTGEVGSVIEFSTSSCTSMP